MLNGGTGFLKWISEISIPAESLAGLYRPSIIKPKLRFTYLQPQDENTPEYTGQTVRQLSLFKNRNPGLGEA